MKRREQRHYTEEELLLSVVGELDAGAAAGLEAHLEECRECAGVLAGYREVVNSIGGWQVPDVPADRWERARAHLIDEFRRDRRMLGDSGFWITLGRAAQRAWNYALDNPLPTLGYIIAAVAFASERTITVFHLERVLPGTGELIEIVRKAL